MSEYFAVKYRAGKLGYTAKQTAELASVYWKQHPLLEKYYGGPPPVDVQTYGDVTAFDRMETIWEKFHSLEGGSQARIDYLAMVLDELNGLRRRFGMQPVKITDPYWEVNPAPPRYAGSYPSGY
jgi:hypothetical protein